MASNHDLAVKVISSIPAYVEEFKLAFGSGKVDIDKITTAIAEFASFPVTEKRPFASFSVL
jgi:cytochrome c peroxidase